MHRWLKPKMTSPLLNAVTFSSHAVKFPLPPNEKNATRTGRSLLVFEGDNRDRWPIGSSPTEHVWHLFNKWTNVFFFHLKFPWSCPPCAIVGPGAGVTISNNWAPPALKNWPRLGQGFPSRPVDMGFLLLTWETCFFLNKNPPSFHF